MSGQLADTSIRYSNKEPEWSSICNNVFDQYLDEDDVFGFEAGGCERSSSDNSGGLVDFSTGSEQSHPITATLLVPSCEFRGAQGVENGEAKQPKAKEPADFWTKTLRALEQNAAESERKQTLRAARSHPEFLSLGGCPSPPAIPSTPNQSFPAQRRRNRAPTANGRKISHARSMSRGRPTGVLKAPSASNISAMIRKMSTSPAKMMIPSSYQDEFNDVCIERSTWSPKYDLQVPSHSFAESPPLSTRVIQPDNHFASLRGSPSGFVPFAAYDEQLSPLTTTFQQAHIHTPIASPAIDAITITRPKNPYFEAMSHAPVHVLASRSIPLNDTAPLFPERTSSLAPRKFEDFDFGFASASDDPFITTPFGEPDASAYTMDPCSFQNFSAAVDTEVLESTQPHSFPPAGLGISYDPALVSSYPITPAETAISSTFSLPKSPRSAPYYIPPKVQNPQNGVPNAPRHPGRRSECPSTPPPAKESRANQRSRRSSQNRRTKSNNSTPRHSQNLEKGGFVNFTPQDSNKILSGVAPSGSSKTKARREKEAADKRRRLSQAAVRAVVEAGGDLESLAKAGLLQ